MTHYQQNFPWLITVFDYISFHDGFVSGCNLDLSPDIQETNVCIYALRLDDSNNLPETIEAHFVGNMANATWLQDGPIFTLHHRPGTNIYVNHNPVPTQLRFATNVFVELQRETAPYQISGAIALQSEL